MATLEEQALAAIDAAEAMAVANAQLIRNMRALLPSSVRPLATVAPDLFERQVGLVADLERGAVRQVAKTAKKKRRKSKYNREFGIQLKKLKKKHPRTQVTQLMSRAHTATRKALKMPRRRR